MEHHSPITVYYDGKCGLCNREIRYYQAIAPSHLFQWQDIANYPEALQPFGISQAQGLRYLHASDGQRLHVGVDAFLLIWRQLPRWRILAWLVSRPGIHTLSQALYKTFAN